MVSTTGHKMSIMSQTANIPITNSNSNSVRSSNATQISNNCKLSRQLHQPHVTLLEYKSMRFVITDQPNSCNMENFIVVCRLHKVGILVRVCEPTYNKEMLEDAGIRVVDLEFSDGASPPDEVLDEWFRLIVDLQHQNPQYCVAVHCIAGLGRAPVLVAAALIELGLSYDEAVEMIRERRNGALNARQIQYLKNFRPRKRLRNAKSQTVRCRLL